MQFCLDDGLGYLTVDFILVFYRAIRFFDPEMCFRTYSGLGRPVFSGPDLIGPDAWVKEVNKIAETFKLYFDGVCDAPY